MPFSFSKENAKIALQILERYPEGRSKSALMPLLYLAQEQNNNYISNEVIVYVADYLSLPVAKVEEVVSFYTMFNREPVGKYHVQHCGTTPCMLMGSEKVQAACMKYLNLNELGQTTKDNLFTVSEVECLGACSTGPVVQINNDYYENLDEKSFIAILDNLKKKK